MVTTDYEEMARQVKEAPDELARLQVLQRLSSYARLEADGIRRSRGPYLEKVRGHDPAWHPLDGAYQFSHGPEGVRISYGACLLAQVENVGPGMLMGKRLRNLVVVANWAPAALAALKSAQHAIDDAGSVVDAGDGEARAYEAELAEVNAAVAAANAIKVEATKE